jgi:GMP synthase (glutamine-hydrolysing)
MKRAVALRHVAFEDLDGFAPMLAARGYKVEYCEAPTDDLASPDLAQCDLLVVLGGPIGAYEEECYPFLTPEIALIKARLETAKPVLGICLGAQLMARALGARVHPGLAKEIGWSPLELSAAGKTSCLGKLKPGAAVLHWHGDTFDLPAGAVHLASTRQTRNQAFALGSHGLALQFHLETTAQGLERWLVGHAGEIASTPGIGVNPLRADSARHAPELAPQAKAVLEAWLDGLADAPSHP